MAHTVRRRTAAALAAAGALLLSVAVGQPARAQDDPDDENITFTVGVSQEIDSLNLSIGLLVVDYEVWNLQYAALVDLSDEDFSPVPGLAESWTSSDDGLTWTYTLRDGLVWSDGEPLTADDVAYSIERPRDEEWACCYENVKNLEATVVDPLTVEVTTSVPDPKLPAIGVYVIPKHVYEPIDTDALADYKAEDGIGSGPFVLTEHNPGEAWRMARNESWYGDAPYIDEIIFRYFADPDQMVTALENGEVDAIDSVDEDLIGQVEGNEDLVTVSGRQGGFSHVGINTGGGLGDGHPALADKVVRQAINRAINRQVLVDEVLDGRGTAGTVISAAYSTLWEPEIPEDEQFSFDPDRANQELDDAGYLDTDGDGIREMPDGTNPLRMRLHIRADTPSDEEKAEFIGPWLADIGIDTEVLIATEDELTAILGRGEFDMFTWGWVPFADPTGMLSSLICDQVTVDPEEPLYNDANWCNEEYDRLYEEQNQELDRDRRIELVHEMLRLFYEEAPYVVLYKYDEIAAYSNDWTGFIRQPAETGPIIFNNSSHSYLTIRPVDVPERGTTSPPTTGDGGQAAGADGDDGGVSTGVVVGAIVGAGAIGAIAIASVMAGRRRRAEDRE
jgi:peptide/nickel transport system substrate-binding protein